MLRAASFTGGQVGVRAEDLGGADLVASGVTHDEDQEVPVHEGLELGVETPLTGLQALSDEGVERGGTRSSASLRLAHGVLHDAATFRVWVVEAISCA